MLNVLDPQSNDSHRFTTKMLPDLRNHSIPSHAMDPPGDVDAKSLQQGSPAPFVFDVFMYIM